MEHTFDKFTQGNDFASVHGGVSNIKLQFSHMEVPQDLQETFRMMISHEGLKGIIEFLLHNQNEFIVKIKQHDDTIDK